MPRKSLFTLVLGLLVLAGIGVSHAQTPVTVMNWNHQWRYLLTNAFPTGWSASNYNADAWPQGNGTFTFPAAEALPAVATRGTTLATNFNNNFVTSFYFRASITLTSDPTRTAITGQAVVDDGAVIYVNGREAQRIRMPAGTIGPNTFANAGGEVTGPDRLDAVTLASSNFVQGVNVIAVEVHQDAGTSSDVVFGLTLNATIQDPPVITQQPQDQEINPGQRATFTVAATGATPLTYRWFSNDVLVATLSTPTYNTPFFTDFSGNGSIYHVIVSNRLGTARSANAVLRITQDVTGPVLTNAVPATGNRVALTFDEALTAGPNTALTNFAIFVFGTTNRVTFTNVTASGVNGVLLTLASTESLTPATDYLVCAYNQQDARSNIMAQSCIGIGFSTTNTIFPFELEWAFTYGLGPPAANWTQPNYVLEPIWAPDGSAPFFQDQVFTGTLCGSVAGDALTALSTTYYFRLPFTVPTGTDLNQPVQMQYMVDDAAVFYLNGTEFHRFNMPAGVVTHTTLASSAREANCTTFLNTNLSGLLRIGNNVMAVSVHQVADEGGLNNDVVFDTRLSFVFQDRPAIPSLMAIRTLSGAVQIRYTTNAPGWVLESAANIDGPWSLNTAQMQVISRTNILQVTPGTAETNRFYRLRNP